MDQKKRSVPQAGEIISGFAAVKCGRIERMEAETVLFSHGASGAELLVISNDDEELGFNIIYRTPSLDESDANHVLEHGIAAASGKYPGRDVFFDAAGKSCCTFLNAYTYPVMTCYPVCSCSEKQLIKLIDITMSCMTDSDYLRNPRIFQREGIRFELRDAKEPIRMSGTVYSEDFSCLTDIGAESSHNLLHALYPGRTAANEVGRVHRNFQELTYERTLEVYRNFYAFSNCLIVLYGRLDYRGVMEFLDREYLSEGQNKYGIEDDPRAYFKEETESGHVEGTYESPAYEGDAEENASVLEYGIDLSGLSRDERFQMGVFADLMDHENSPFHRRLMENGVFSRAYCDLPEGYAAGFFTLGLEDGEERQRDALRLSVRQALEEIVESGVEEDILNAVVKDRELSDRLTREHTALGADVSVAVGLDWAVSGETDFFQRQKAALDMFRGKPAAAQEAVRKLARRLSGARRSALVVTSPRPGLAEQLEKEREDWLEWKKSRMTAQEIAALIEETEAFDCWNRQEAANNDFIVEPSELSDPAPSPPVGRLHSGSVTIFTAPAQTDGAGCFRLLFDTSLVGEMDLYDLSLFTLLLMELNTARFTVEELKNMEPRYLNRLSVEFAYPDRRAGKHHHPMLSIKWFALTEDLGEGLELVKELLGGAQFDSADEIARVIEKYMSLYDLSRCDDALDLALDLAAGSVDLWQRYQNYMEGQGFFRFLGDTLERLGRSPASGRDVGERLESIKRRIFHRGNLCVMIAAGAMELPDLRRIAEEKLRELPLQDLPDPFPGYRCLEMPAKRRAVCLEASDQCTVRLASFSGVSGFSGRYLPFFMAAGDRYLIPKIRFEGGAYGAGSSLRLSLGQLYLYSSSDPNTKATLRSFDDLEEYLRGMKLTQEELNGYILNTYAAAARPRGRLSRAMTAMGCALEGVDLKAEEQLIREIRNAVPEDGEQAAAALSEVLHEACTVTAGNGARMEEIRGCFDEIEDYRL